jgi:hypothetical protein
MDDVTYMNASPKTNANETATSLLAAKAEAEAKSRYAIAVARPRDEDAARQRILKACARPRFADAARYTKPLGGGKSAIGLSVRFAEEAARLWGNIHQDMYVLVDDEDKLVLHCVVTDLETNTAAGAPMIVPKYVERRQPREGDEVLSVRQNSTGKQVYRIRANEDAMLVKMNALAAKLRRGLILQLLPADLKEEAMDFCAETARRSDAKDPDAARKAMLDRFYGIGVAADELKRYVGKPLEQLAPADVDHLRQVYAAVSQGEASFSDFANRKKKAEGTRDDGGELLARLQARQEAE